MSHIEKNAHLTPDSPEPAEQPSPNNQENPSEDKVGPYLRAQRVKKGLSISQVSELTNIRPSFIAALENEVWEDLPSPVFAGGFVRSYGRSLGLNEEKLMGLFHKSGPKVIPAPELLLEPVKIKKPPLFILVFLLLALIPAYFFWKGYAVHEKSKISQEMTIEEEKETNDQAESTGGEVISPEQTEQIPTESNTKPAMKPDKTDAEEALQADNVEEQVQASEADQSSDEDEPQMAVTLTLTLEIKFKETTWLRIAVDGREPKEYTFYPNQRFQWNAKEGFELLIGNAGGIDIEFNGNAIETFGKPGQVVHLTLPKSYERKVIQN